MENFELGFELREGAEIPQTVSEFQTVEMIKLKEQSPTDLRLRLGILSSLTPGSEGLWSLICAVVYV